MPPSLVQAELKGAQGHTLHKLLPLPQMPRGEAGGEAFSWPSQCAKVQRGGWVCCLGECYWRTKARVYGSWPPGSLEYQGKFCFYLYIMLQENQVL